MRRRIEGLNRALVGISLNGFPDPVTVSVSFGLASFSELGQIEQAIEQADGEMYAAKPVRKAFGTGGLR